MKNLFLGLLVLCLGFASCNSDKAGAEKTPDQIQTDTKLKNADEIRNEVNTEIPSDTVNVAKIEFAESTFDYGTIKEGDVVDHSFKFKNVGIAPLTISKAASTCGCTVPEFPKEPIAPGAEGEITVRFNSKGKSGRNRKPINVTANTWPVTTTAYIDGTVQKDESKQAADNKPKSK